MVRTRVWGGAAVEREAARRQKGVLDVHKISTKAILLLQSLLSVGYLHLIYVHCSWRLLGLLNINHRFRMNCATSGDSLSVNLLSRAGLEFLKSCNNPGEV